MLLLCSAHAHSLSPSLYLSGSLCHLTLSLPLSPPLSRVCLKHQQAIELASANVHLTRLATPGLPADQMWGQHVIHYLIHKLHVQVCIGGGIGACM